MCPVGGVLLHGEAELLQPVGGFVEPAAGQDVGQRRWPSTWRPRPGVLGEKAQPPWTVTGPAAAAASPPRTFSRLVLPAPLRPTRPDLVAGAHQ